jgi:hypothetical protein
MVIKEQHVQKRPIHLINWTIVLTPKKFEELGIRELRLMNQTMLMK